MKRTTFIAAVLCLLGAGLSCTHDEPNNSDTGTSQRVVEWQDSTLSGDAVIGMKMLFNVGGGMSVERTAQTRATTDINGTATFSTNDLVAVAVTRSGGSEVVKLYKVKSDGSLEYAGGDNDPFVWTSSSETVSLRAWSYGTSTNLAYTLTAPETRDYTLETDQNTNGYLELLYCKAADKSYSGGTISLNFYHQLARVVFNVTHERSGTLSVTSSSVGNSTSFPVAARFSVPTGSSNVGTWATRSTYGTITPKTETTQSGYQKTYSAIIFPQTYAQDTKLFTITNDDGNYVYNVSEAAGASLSAGNQYNYTINVLNYQYDIKKNPLWYVCEGNMTNVVNASTLTMSTGNVGYFYTWTDAMTTFTGSTTQRSSYYTGGKTISGISNATWHLPIRYEWFSIIPFVGHQKSLIATITNTDNTAATFPVSSNVCFGYNATTKGTSGTYMTENSYWFRVSTKLFYAIRFCDSDYCSLWKYQIQDNSAGSSDVETRRANPCTLTITSRLLKQSISTTQAASIYGTTQSKWEAELAGLNFTTENHGIIEGSGAVQRVFYARGVANSSASSAAFVIGTDAYFWAAAGSSSARGYQVSFDTTQLYHRDNTISDGFNIRLFRDN